MSTAAIHHGHVAIQTKPSVPIGYSFIEGARQLRHGPETLVIFCSGFCDPRKVWNPTVAATVKLREQKPYPPLFLYDRFGSGETGRDPTDEGKDPKDTHDVMDAARDLRELLICVAELHLAIPENKINDLRLVFVAHSMGAAVAELYAKAYPNTVAALLVLDGTPTISDGLVWYPNPDAPDFSLAALPEGITPELLRKGRAQQEQPTSVFNPNNINDEGLRWINLPDYIPIVGAPKLQGPIPGTPLLTVVAHDPVPYAKQFKKVSLSKSQRPWQIR
jgi:pimeloyl-ACP methyl ester carboxylesterase